MSALATIELEESMNSTQDDPGGSHSVVSTNSIKSKSNEELHAESTVECGGREIYQQLPSENVDGGRNDLREKQGELESRLFDEESGHDLHHNDENATPSRKRKRTRRKQGYELDLELDKFDYDSEDEKRESCQDIDNDGKKPSFGNRFVNECVALLCPCFILIRALCRCDMNLFYKLSSSIFVIKAFWSSILTLGICTLFKVRRVIPDFDSNVATPEAYLFGLWTYTAKLVEGKTSLEGLIEGEIERIETCNFHMQQVVEDAPDNLFLNDAIFIVARVCAFMVVGIGCIAMISVLLMATNIFKSCCFGRKRWFIPTMLITCSVLESFVFLIFASSVCRDTKYQEQRHCSLEPDSGIVFASIFSWLISAAASIKVQARLNDDGVEDLSLYVSTGEKILDETFDASDDSSHNSADSSGPSTYEIS